MSKPRISYSEFQQMKYAAGSIAGLLERRLTESHKPGARRIGPSQTYIVERLQKAAIGSIQHEKLKVMDIVDYCRERIAAGVKPQTVMCDITVLGGLMRHAYEVWELPETGLKIFKKAKPQLMREQLIGKSVPRDRLPTNEELTILRAFFVEENQRPRNKIDMVLVMDAELVTGRRISELCRIERQHVDVAKRTCWIYNLKNAKGKGYHDEFALIEGAWELFERRLTEIPDHPEAKLFPFQSHSCSARYTAAKNVLRKLHPGLFINLRMHDNRAKCFVRLLDKGYSPIRIRKGVSLHRNPNTFDNYVRIKAVDLHTGPDPRQA